MQLQMEVCDLNECDFVETKFIEYQSLEDYMNDGDINYSDDHKEKGIIKVYVRNNEEYKESNRDFHEEVCQASLFSQ